MYAAVLFVFSIILLLGGICLLRCGLQNLLGSRLHQLLLSLTVTPWKGLFAGIGASILLQSSTAVSLITIGLVSANYLSFYQSLGIILGANIGTCTTVQLMALSLPDQYFAPLLLACICIMLLLRPLRYPAMALSGLLAIFAGIALLSDTIGQISGLSKTLQYLIADNTSPLYGIAGGILMTIILQSSSAATALLMVFAEDKILDLTTASYVIYGNNIGSCISSVIIGAASPLAAKRVAAAHLILNIGGTILFLPLTSLLTSLSTVITADFSGQIAFIHTAFNVLSSIIVLPFIKHYAKLIIFLVPGKKLI